MSTGAVVAGRQTYELARGWLDELEIHLVPVLLGGGRLFEHVGIDQRELERLRVLEGDGRVTHLRHRVRRMGHGT